MSGLGWEEPVEPGDGGVGAHEQAVERGENGFSLENFPLAKRYAEGKVEVHVHFAGRRVGRDRELPISAPSSKAPKWVVSFSMLPPLIV